MALEQQARDVLEPLGYELLEVQRTQRSGTAILLVRIDRLDETAVTLDDVQVASEALSLDFDRAEPMGGRYNLEVESPGANRPLRTRRHFERFAGLKVNVKTGSESLQGAVVSADDQDVTLDVNGERRSIPLNDIHAARLAEWPSEPR